MLRRAVDQVSFHECAGWAIQADSSAGNSPSNRCGNTSGNGRRHDLLYGNELGNGLDSPTEPLRGVLRGRVLRQVLPEVAFTVQGEEHVVGTDGRANHEDRGLDGSP